MDGMEASHREAEWNAWLQQGGGPQWLRPARSRLTQAPDPAAARNLASQALAAAAPDELARAAAADPEGLADTLHALAGVAPFFVPRLRTHARWLSRLLDSDLALARDPDELATEIGAAVADSDDPAAALRELKYFELARITVRDCSERLVPIEDSHVTLTELSHLADSLLSEALGVAQQEVTRRFGPPCWLTEDGERRTLAFTVLGMGKLGAEELNYSSDVDLVYVFESPRAPLQPAVGGEALAELPPTEYFTRVGQRFGKLVASSTTEGFLYRVDLDLRPEGPQGTLVVSDESLAVYYESWADTWEKATFMKARPVAGDLGFGWRAVRAVAPMIYRSAMDYGAVEAIKELKRRIEAQHGGREQQFNVKIDAGGIRDVEFVAQAMQLLHGGRIEQVRARSTPDSLVRLRDVDLLPDDRVEELLQAYRFFRRVENRLQMVAERQTHRLPKEPEALRRIARAVGFLDGDERAALLARIESHRERVEAVFHDFFFDSGSERIFDLFAHRVPQLLASDTSRKMLWDLAAEFAREVDASPNAERALNNLGRFVENIGAHRFYLELLLDRPELVPRLTALFATSNFLSSVLATHPELIEPVFHDPDTLLLDRWQLDADLCSILEKQKQSDEDAEAELDALRLFFHRHILNVGLLDLGGKITREQAETALTEIAETCLTHALRFSRAWVQGRRPALAEAGARMRFLVVGMGKVASHELSYGSDLDLIFVFDVDTEGLDEGETGAARLEAQEFASRLAQRLMSTLQTRTTQGACYEVDARLRPSGNQGALVSSIAAFERYHEKSAEVWERLVLLRARPAAGDPGLGEHFEKVRRDILARPLSDRAAAEAALHHIRRRMEDELARETAGHRDFKRGRGGMLDVENVVQWKQLLHGADHPELLDVVPLSTQLRRLRDRSLLPEADADTLERGWAFLQRLSNRLRVVENRSISDLDAERGDLDSLARALGYAAGDREGEARRALLTDYERHTEAIRQVYERVFSGANDDTKSS
jgi:glutamate-ammonia-ligase adenylyltransferase